MAGPALVVGREEAVGVDRGLGDRVGPLECRERHGAALALAAGLRDVGQDSEDPGLQRRPPLEAVDSFEDADPRFLDDVFGDGAARDVDQRDAKERSVVLPH